MLGAVPLWAVGLYARTENRAADIAVPGVTAGSLRLTRMELLPGRREGEANSRPIMVMPCTRAQMANGVTSQQMVKVAISRVAS